jgi:hypothetical protein
MRLRLSLLSGPRCTGMVMVSGSGGSTATRAACSSTVSSYTHSLSGLRWCYLLVGVGVGSGFRNHLRMGENRNMAWSLASVGDVDDFGGGREVDGARDDVGVTCCVAG